MRPLVDLAEAILGFLGALLMLVAPARDQIQRLRSYRARAAQAGRAGKRGRANREGDIPGSPAENAPPQAHPHEDETAAPSVRKKGLSELFRQNAEAHEARRNAWHPVDALTMAAGALLLALSFALRIVSL